MRQHDEWRGLVGGYGESFNFCRCYQPHIPWSFEESIDKALRVNLFEPGGDDRDHNQNMHVELLCKYIEGNLDATNTPKKHTHVHESCGDVQVTSLEHTYVRELCLAR